MSHRDVWVVLLRTGTSDANGTMSRLAIRGLAPDVAILSPGVDAIDADIKCLGQMNAIV